MQKKIEKILNSWVLLSLNILILIVTELSGKFFQETGIIHLIAILFVLLGISRIFVHYDAYDRYLRLLILGGTAALVIFSVSHLMEFLGYVYFHTYQDAIFASVINLYIMSMLAVMLGAQYFLQIRNQKSAITIWALSMSLVIFLFSALLIFFQKIPVSLDTGSPAVYIYGVLILGAGFLSVSRLIKIKKYVPMMAGFVNYFIGAFVLVTVSALQYVFYNLLEKLGLPEFQIIYVSHFLFYGALTLMFLAFVRLTGLGGIYKEIEKHT